MPAAGDQALHRAALIGPNFPFDHRFDGDTLIFHPDVRSKPKEIYQGPVAAWRPGWVAARALTSDKGLTCFGLPGAAVAACMDDAFTGRPVQFDLLAGPLRDVEGAGARLPLMGRLVAQRADDEVAWQAAFSPRGDYFAFSSLEPSTGREVLRAGPVGQLDRGPPPEIVYNAARWRISHDGKKVYFLRDFNYGRARPLGELSIADFPSGQNVTPLRAGVGAFDLVPDLGEVDQGVGLFEGLVMGEGDFLLMRDRARPEQLVTIARKIEFASSSFDGRFTYYPFFNRQGGQEAHIARNDGSGECLLNEDPLALVSFAHFLSPSSLVFWSEQREDTNGAYEGWFGRPDDCGGSQRFAARLGILVTSGNSLVVFGEQVEGTQFATLKYARLTAGGGWPAEGAQVIRERADRWVTVIDAPAGAHILFQVDDAPADEQGLYLFGPVPLARRP